MPTPGQPRSPGRSVRVLRLTATLAVIIALVAIVTVVKGDPAGRSEALVKVAIIFGAVALLGMGFAVSPYIKKAKNDPRS